MGKLAIPPSPTAQLRLREAIAATDRFAEHVRRCRANDSDSLLLAMTQCQDVMAHLGRALDAHHDDLIRTVNGIG